MELATPASSDAGTTSSDSESVARTASKSGSDRPLPDQVAYMPVQKPVAVDAATAEVDREADTGKPAAAAEEEAGKSSKAVAASPPATGGAVLQNGGPILTAGTMPGPPPKKKGLFSSFFGATPAEAAPAPIAEPVVPPKAKAAAKQVAAEAEEPAEEPARPLRMASLGSSGYQALPGVRDYDGLFEIKRKSGLDDISDVDIHEDEDGAPVVLASAAGMARLAPNGLLKQRDSVDVACLKPNLVRLLKTVEGHYRKKMVVTSGYRSPAYNRKVNGAQKSQHMYCAAADVQIPGVSKWELARFVRAMPNRGGVGTYCHTESVHIDVGPERDWNWRCRRRS